MAQVLRRLPPVVDPNALVGTETRDDAAVYRMDAKRAIVVTTDFFAPVLDDPFKFGQVAAANALSDVYAMGGRPLFALNLVGFPANVLPMRILGKILDGGASKVAEAGASLLGGHTVEDAEPKYGLVVVGEVSPRRVFRNVGARAGDHLILTKPLGSGIVTTAIKRGKARPADVRAVTNIMATLNATAAEVLTANHRSVHAVTDVTGYGLLGHLLEMLSEGDLDATIEAERLPILPAAARFAALGIVPGGTRSNLRAAGRKLRLTGGIDRDDPRTLILADAQTSGGLLAAVSARSKDRVLAGLAERGVKADVVGRMQSGSGRVHFVP